MQLLQNVRAFAGRHALWRAETRVVVALSGGADSVALLVLLHELASAGEVTLAGAAHLNHGIRGADADQDQEFCERLCARIGVPLATSGANVPALAASRGTSLEVTARRVRLPFLDEARQALAADVVATAHTRDDQAETVLLRLVRGAGLRGLGGIRPRRDRLIRPLLESGRDDLRAYLTARGQSWREDSTNADRSIPRNRMRHDVLPEFARHFNPSVTRAFSRFATLAAADEAFLDASAADALERISATGGQIVELDGAALALLDPALARRVVGHALARVKAGRSWGLDEIDRVLGVAAGDMRAAELRGVRAERSGSLLVLSRSGAATAVAPFQLGLPIPGSVELATGGWRLEAARRALHEVGLGRSPGHGRAPSRVDVAEIVADGAALGDRLIVRSRQPGDALRPLGAPGRRKLQDVFVDRKVRRHDRDAVPVVTDETGRIVWVAGHAMAHEFRVTSQTSGVVVLKWQLLAPGRARTGWSAEP